MPVANQSPLPPEAPSPASSSSVSFADPETPPPSGSADSAAAASASNGDDLLATCLELIAGDGGEHQVGRAQKDLLSSESQPLEAQPQPPAEHPQLLHQKYHCLQIPNPPIPQSFPSAALGPALDHTHPAIVPVVFAPPPRVFVVHQPPIRSQVLACIPLPARPVFLHSFPQSAVHIPQAAVPATSGTASLRRPSLPGAEGGGKSRKRREKNTVMIKEGEECVDDPGEVGRVELTSPKKKRPPHCDICGREFSAERFLRLHVAEIHEEGGKGRFTCGDCGKVYTRLRSLERHQNRHHLDGDPVCKICRKRVVNFDLHYRRFHCKSKSTQACPKSKRRRKKKAHKELEMTD